MGKFPVKTAMIFVLSFAFLTTCGCLGLLDQGPQAVLGEAPSLFEIYAAFFDLGGAVSVASWAPQTLLTHRSLIEKHFNSVTAENAMKPDYLQPREGSFNFREADQLVTFALENGMKVRGHTLVWHNQTPDWFFKDAQGRRIDQKENITEAERQLVIQRLEAHIEAVMTHFGDKVYAWDVVNEAVPDGVGIHRQDSPWYRIIGEDYIKLAFQKAHEVNPYAKLFYNDYNAVMTYKRGKIISLLEELIAEGVPLHGIGIQGHWGVGGPSISEIESALQLYSELGLEIHITELDISLDGRTEREQAQRYASIFRLLRDYSQVVTNVTFWGISDDTSWKRSQKPLLFDEQQEPKPAFWAIVDPERPWQENLEKYCGLR